MSSPLYPTVCFHTLPSPLPCSDSVISNLQERDIALCFGNVNEIFFHDANLYEMISPHQQSEAEKIKNAERRNRFIAIRACLNAFLSHFTGMKTSNHIFVKCESGKPFLKLPESSLQFNLSHSGDFFLMAVSINPVGVDLENKDRKIPELKDIITRYYTFEEQAAVKSSAYPEESFLKIWTMKEAVVKALGTGIHENLKTLNTLRSTGHETRPQHLIHVYSGSLNEFFFSIATPCHKADIKLYGTAALL